jgi:hypothetical protein
MSKKSYKDTKKIEIVGYQWQIISELSTPHTYKKKGDA